jgi:Flp pilus assembly protein TadD
MNDRRKLLEDRIAFGADSALMRFALGKMVADDGDTGAAIAHLARALELDPNYAAAWSLLGKAHAAAGEVDKAADAYQRGIDVAEQKGEIQAARQMRVFLKRLQKLAGN